MSPTSGSCLPGIGALSKTIPIPLAKPKFTGEAPSLNWKNVKKNSTIAKASPKNDISNQGTSTLSHTAAANGKMIAGNRYLTLDEISKSLQLKTLLDSKKGQIILTKGGAQIQFSSGQDYITYQQSKIFLAHSILFQGNDLLVSYGDYLNVLVPLLAINLVSKKKPSLKTIAIDAGHGGKDSGATNSNLHIFEKDITLQIAKLLKTELLREKFLVIETRATDIFIELKDRPFKAKNADFFISIHGNASANKSAHGVEVFTLKRSENATGNAFDPWNLIAGYCVLSKLAAVTKFENRGLKMEKFAVLKSLTIPGILVEIGFITNDAEGKKLADPLFQKQIVQGLVDGIKNYSKNLSKKR
ncbi:MAG: N-acetylmuramoyl-L-alanine amidase [Puniceicoccales bacterium]|jgi:N-acetylmuramoyl-L-alanine amidase|nr:N-acetylmuramoyl-L-alanine amidase [Puniceicoccales bacterium]